MQSCVRCVFLQMLLPFLFLLFKMLVKFRLNSLFIYLALCVPKREKQEGKRREWGKIIHIHMASFVLALFVLLISINVIILVERRRRRRMRRLGLPPGSFGLPLVGETLQLISAYKTENPEPFIDMRVSKYGSLFTTHVFGEPTVFSTDPQTNRFVLQNEGKLFESSYPSSISNLLGRKSLLLMKGTFHKRMHSLVTSFANSSIIRDHLLVDIDRLIRFNLHTWDGMVRLQDQTKKVITLNPINPFVFFHL